MDIDFVKWMCKKAESSEDFRWIDVNTNIVKPDCQRIPWEYIEKNPYYPLLLQRAIEGVNSTNRTYDIMYQNNSIKVYDDELSHTAADYWRTVEIDEAKELALKYIYEQEKK